MVLYKGDDLLELRLVVSFDKEDLGDFLSCLRIVCNRVTGWLVFFDH